MISLLLAMTYHRSGEEDNAQAFSCQRPWSMKYFHDLEVARSKKGIVLNQRNYTPDILHDFGLPASKPIDFPMEQKLQLLDTEGELVTGSSMYRRLVEHFFYLTVTRPDITYSLHVPSRFMKWP